LRSIIGRAAERDIIKVTEGIARLLRWQVCKDGKGVAFGKIQDLSELFGSIKTKRVSEDAAMRPPRPIFCALGGGIGEGDTCF
jgi:hypothetical protein